MLIRDIHLMVDPGAVEILPGVPAALGRARAAGFALVAVTNQSVVARGLCSEGDVEAVHARIDDELTRRGAGPLDRYEVCPHHPDATDPVYRVRCACRKPAPGMILRAAAELGVSLQHSYTIGDRLTDVLAGHRAGTGTVLVGDGNAPLLRGVDPDELVDPDLRVVDLGAAVSAITAVLP